MSVHFRTALVGAALLASTALPTRSHLVRFHPTPDTPYDRMIVVSERDAGRDLYLQGWIGKPLTRAQWKEAKDQLFPNARTVSWERRLEDGSFRPVQLSLTAAEKDA